MVVCGNCNQDKNSTEFSKCSRKKNGLQTNCKECAADLHRKWKDENRERSNKYRRDYSKKNRDILNSQHNRWEAKNAEYVKKYHADYQKNNSQRIAVRMKKWNIDNAEYLSEKRKVYYQENKEMYIVAARNREVREKTLGNVTIQEYRERLAELGDICVYCGGPGEHWDHVYPISKGGSHTIGNLVRACSSCNLSKHVKTYEQFGRPFSWMVI